jgi:hypothetical protein
MKWIKRNKQSKLDIHKGYITFAKKNVTCICHTWNNILNAKEPNIKLFSIPIVLACKMFNAQKVDLEGHKLSLQLLEPFYIDK